MEEEYGLERGSGGLFFSCRDSVWKESKRWEKMARKMEVKPMQLAAWQVEAETMLARASMVSRAPDRSRMRVRSSEPTFCPEFSVRPGNGF